MAAIYMWRIVKELLLTTTLYPVDAVDEVQITMSFADGNMTPIPEDDYEVQNLGFVTPTYIQTRWFYEDGPYDDAYEVQNLAVLTPTYVQTRWFYEDGPYDDNYEVTNLAAISVNYVQKVIKGDTPDEELQIDFTFVSGSMPGV